MVFMHAVWAASSSGNTTIQTRNLCSFEHDLCGWTQMTSDQLDWIRVCGPTSTEAVPRKDHTLGTDDGCYISIQTSGNVNRRDTAQLISPELQPGPSCLSFWYSVYGSMAGSLNVKIQGSAPSSRLLWSAEGKQRKHWFHARVPLISKSSYHVLLEGVRSAGFSGSIAVDDLSIENGDCDMDDTATGRVLSRCEFEGSMCTFTQEKTSDDIDWTLHRGPTPTINTGPDHDHTFGNSMSWYVYLETSSPRKPGETARLNSQLFSPMNEPACVIFWYYMYGMNVGSLRVLQTGPEQIIWEKNGNQGRGWKEALISIPVSRLQDKFHIIFEGVVGSSWLGDIAIDDFILMDGLCPNPQVG